MENYCMKCERMHSIPLWMYNVCYHCSNFVIITPELQTNVRQNYTLVSDFNFFYQISIHDFWYAMDQIHFGPSHLIYQFLPAALFLHAFHTVVVGYFSFGESNFNENSTQWLFVALTSSLCCHLGCIQAFW